MRKPLALVVLVAVVALGIVLMGAGLLHAHPGHVVRHTVPAVYHPTSRPVKNA